MREGEGVHRCVSMTQNDFSYFTLFCWLIGFKEVIGVKGQFLS